MKRIGWRYSLLLLGSFFVPACLWWQKQPIVNEYFMTKHMPDSNVDSVAIWHGASGEQWLIATAKTAHTLPVYDATNGSYLHAFGRPGTALGELQRPNGIAIADDLLFVVERDNKRLQLFSLPSGKPLGMITEPMERPYGIAVYAMQPEQSYVVYITDNAGPKDPFYPKKVHQYLVKKENDQVTISYLRSFGDTEGKGALWKVESIAVDAPLQRLYVADEHEKQKNVKIYDLDGQFTGMTIADGLLLYEPEGIAIYRTGPSSGYVVVTDQDRVGNQFLLFDRERMQPVGSFAGKVMRNTDGIAISERAFGPFAKGAFYAVHNDGNIGAYDWQQLATALHLKQ